MNMHIPQSEETRAELSQLAINICCAPDQKTANPVFDNGIIVDNSEILYGILDKKMVSATQGGLIHVIFHEKAPRPCVRSSLVYRWLSVIGFLPG
ncbi:hypothetical protein EDD17DRAFT_1609934, partial [Pisolithus thermaeus]